MLPRRRAASTWRGSRPAGWRPRSSSPRWRSTRLSWLPTCVLLYPGLSVNFPELVLPPPAKNKRLALAKFWDVRAVVPKLCDPTERRGKTSSVCPSLVGAVREPPKKRTALQLGRQYGIARRLFRATGRLDGYRYRIALLYRGRDRRRRLVAAGMEEAAGFGYVALDHPDLARLSFGYRGQAVGYQNDPVFVYGRHFGVGPLIRPRSAERDRLGLLVLLVPNLGLQVVDLTLRVPNLALQILYQSLQQQVPGEQADQEQSRGPESEAPGAYVPQEPGEHGLSPATAGRRLGLDHLHDLAAEFRRRFLLVRGERQQARDRGELV